MVTHRACPGADVGDVAASELFVDATERRRPVSVRHALLALLSEGPKYGLQLRQEFEARTGEVWPLNVGQVYSTAATTGARRAGGVRWGRRGDAEGISDHTKR